MALRIVAARPDPDLLTLPWSVPLEEWTDHVVPLPRGLSRHVVRTVRLGDRTYAVKETTEELARREHDRLRELQALHLPAVTPQGVVTGRTDVAGEPLPAALLTEHLRFSLPYRSLFRHGLTAADVPAVVDALVVLLVRLHLAGFYWGDVSLSNALFRRSAGGFAAYLVDAETGERHPVLGDRLREHDVTVGSENVFAELLDLEASRAVEGPVQAHEVVRLLTERYATLWRELTEAEEFDADEMWRIQQRVERLNDLGFDVEELEIAAEGTHADGSAAGRIRIQPRVVELGHHCRELRALTGLDVEDAQARRLLNDIAAFTAHHRLGDRPRALVAARWLTEVWEPIQELVPDEARGKLEPAEVFHEILVHRWYLSEQAGEEVDIFVTARDYIDRVLRGRPDEAVAGWPTGMLAVADVEEALAADGRERDRTAD